MRFKSGIIIIVAVLVVGAIAPTVVVADDPSSGDSGSDAGVTTQQTDTVTVSGRILEADGTPAANDTVILYKNRRTADGELEYIGIGPRTRTDDQGNFQLDVDYGFTYELVHYQFADANLSTSGFEVANETTTFPVDNSPDMFAFDVFTPTSDRSLGEYRPPVGYLYTPVAGVGQFGNEPLTATRMSVYHNPRQTDAAAGIVNVNVNDQGEFLLNGKSTAGMELSGRVTAVLTDYETSRYVTGIEGNSTTVTVDGPTRSEINLRRNSPPEVGSVIVTNRTPSVGQTVTFNSFNISDPDGDSIDRIGWDFTSNGEIDATGTRAVHQFQSAGNVTTTAVAIDEHGLFGTVTINLTVSGPDVPPVGSAPPTNVDDDPALEDVDGSGTAGFPDVIALLFLSDPTPAQEDAFDFTGDGKFDFGDVIALLFEVQ